MFENRVKKLLDQGQPAIGQWLVLPSPAVAELLAGYGMDWLLIDTEHGAADWQTVEDMIRGMKSTAVVPLVRVGGNDPILIKRALDRGASGVVVPLVNTAEQARAAVAACKYPPDGIRGVAGGRANRYGADLVQYVSAWNQQVLVVCQLETREAVKNVEAIAAVPGVDILFIGPNDLSANLDQFRQFKNPEFTNAVGRILQASKAHGKTAGIMASAADDTLEFIDEGFRFISVGSDARMLGGSASSTYEKIREGLKERTIHEAP